MSNDNLLQCLNYPLDSKFIFRKKSSIRAKLLTKPRKAKMRVAILGGSTTAEIRKILEIFLLNEGIQPTFYESEYNKFYEDALFSSDVIKKFSPDVVYIHTTNVNIQNFPTASTNEKDFDDSIASEVAKYKSIWTALEACECPILQNNFDFLSVRPLGNFDCYHPAGKTRYISELNRAFALAARETPNLYINDINYLSSYMGINNWFDTSLWLRTKYAVSITAIPELCSNIAKILVSLRGGTKKCLVLDLDNTCWGGVIGDVGMGGIDIGLETAMSEAYTYFQQYVRDLKEQGVILAVCSKNELENAEEGFNHPDTILRRVDFSAFVANWNPKNEGIVSIAQQLNISLDSLVFIDDNPAERDLISMQTPDVSVPNIGSSIEAFIDFIDKGRYFELTSFSGEDSKRTMFYADNAKRETAAAAFTSHDDYLASLDMTSEIKAFPPVYMERIGQLINKTNQFNLTTKRYTIGELNTISENDNYIKLYGTLDDKFGKNGVVSVIIGEVKHSKCYVDLWLMSCRVLKRGLKYAMFDVLVAHCQEMGVHTIVGKYACTDKNAMVKELYGTLGFVVEKINDEGSSWYLSIDTYTKKNKLIGVSCD